MPDDMMMSMAATIQTSAMVLPIAVQMSQPFQRLHRRWVHQRLRQITSHKHALTSNQVEDDIKMMVGIQVLKLVLGVVDTLISP